MLSVALLAAVVMTSCGKSACDCKTEAMDLMSNSANAIGDEAQIKEYDKLNSSNFLVLQYINKMKTFWSKSFFIKEFMCFKICRVGVQ